MEKKQKDKRRRKNLKHSETGTVHASGNTWKTYGPMCRDYSLWYNPYKETDEEVSCGTCKRILNGALYKSAHLS